MNPNHPHYAGLGGGPNLNLLDNMLMAAGFQATEQPVVARPAIVPQYSYAQDVSSMQHHALNLGQTHTTTMAGADPVHVIVYQQQQNEQLQQQPISYKIPQLGTVVSQEQNFVVNDQGGQIRQNPTPVSSHQGLTEAEQIHQSSAQSLSRQIQSPAERRKDIVAQAMQEQKIFEDSVPKQEPIVKQEPGVSNAQASVAGTSSTTGDVVASSAAASTSVDTKPVMTATKTTPTTTPQQRRPYQRSANYNRQQVMPRLQILDDEDDGLTCRMCLASYWYKAELLEHLKTVHSITEPDKYEKEEREKKMRKMREEQQRIIMAKKQREERERRLREAKYGRGRGSIRLPGGGLRSTGPGQRPSFQYRDGAFICDLCKESFSDGNDMVTHWKSHVKKQQADMMKGGRGRGRGRPSIRGRGRPSLEKEASSDSSEDSSGGKKKKKKGMPRWTAYLLWSTRKRREVVVDHPGWTFAEIAKWISEEWKKVDADEKDELQKEAEEMNELGIRKLPRDDDDGTDPEKSTTDADSDFEEGYRKKAKPIMLKIKKEKSGGAAGSSDESDWEPEAEVKPPTRESTRSGRQRKRPSFFQEFESQENNLDTILEQFEKQQAEEFGKPRPPKVEKPETEKKPRKPRKRKEPAEFDVAKVIEEEVEVEVLRSGRKRKVRRVMTSFAEGSDEDDKLAELGGASSDDEDFEPPPEEEVEKQEEHDDQLEDEEEVDSEDLEDEEDEDDLRFGDMDLPPKKRGRTKKLMTEEEIEEATRTAMNDKPALDIIPVNKDDEGKENGEGGEKEKESKEGENEEGGEKGDIATEGGEETGDDTKSDSEKVKPPWVKETLSDSEDEGSRTKEPQSLGTPAPSEMESLDSTAPPLDTPAPLESIDTPAPQDLPEHDDDDHHNNGHSEMDTDIAYTEAAGTAAEVDNVLSHMDTMEQQHNQLNNVAVTHFENPLDKSEVPLSSVADGMDVGDSADAQPSLMEDDLLGGAGHNLDDSQFKADSLEANLEDIFK